MAVLEKMNTKSSKAKIVIGSFEFLSDEYEIESIILTTGCFDGNAVGIGSAYCPNCSVRMKHVPALTEGTKFSIFFDISGWTKYGNFYVSEAPKVYEGKMEFMGYGTISRLGEKYNEGIFDFSLAENRRRFCKLFENKFGESLTFDLSVTGWLTKQEHANILPIKEKKDEKLTGKDAYQYADLTWLEVLQGIAIICGSVVYESESGRIHIKPINDGFGEIEYLFDETSFSESYNVSDKKYGINHLTIKYQNADILSFVFDKEDEYDQNIHGPFGIYLTSSGLRKKEYDIKNENQNLYLYGVEIECPWIRPSLMYFGSSLTYEEDGEFDENLVTYTEYKPPKEIEGISGIEYVPGDFEFIGYNGFIRAGERIFIHNKTSESNIPFFVAEMTLEWDGGFTTKISCPSPKLEKGKSVSTTNSSGVYGIISNQVNGINNYNSLNFVDISFSNVKDSTISGSKFIDGTITGSKIEESTITGNLIANNTLTGNLIKDGTITNNLIQDSTLTGSKFQNGTLTGSLFENGTITNTQIKDSTLTGAKIVDATIGFEKVDTSFITKLTADSAYIDNLTAKVANINTLKADDAIIKNIQTVGINANYIKSLKADIGYLTTTEADIKYADIKLGNIDTANINKANIGLLFNEVGLIDRATIVDGHVTGFLDAVEVNANQITAGTLIAERLLLKGSEDGLLFALNNMGELVSQNVDTLDGGVLTERTVTADKLVAKSITTSELDVTNIFGNKAVIEKIFAQDVTASGKISGAKLYGAYAEIGKGKVGPFKIESDEMTANIGEGFFSLRRNGIQFSEGMGVFSSIYGDGFSFNKEGHTIETQKDSESIVDTKGMYSIVFSDGEAGRIESMWINRHGINTVSHFEDGVPIRTPFDINAKILNVSGQINAKNGLISSSDQGFASIASDTEGGRIQIKGSGNWYEIDAAGGTLRFIDGSAGKEIALMNSNAFYSKGEIVVSNNKSIRFGTPTSGYMIKGTETTITIGDKDTGGNSGYVYLQGDTKVLTGSLDAPKIKEGGELLTEKYCYYQEGTGSVPGGSGWMGVTATFPKPYLKKPFVMVVQNTATSTENIWIEAISEKAVSFKVYAPNSAWTYSYRWMAIGIKA